MAVMLAPGSARIPVAVATSDPVSWAGVASQLRGSDAIEIVDEARIEPMARADAVAVVVADQWDEEAGRSIRALRRRGFERVLLLIGRLDDNGLLAAAEAGACGIVRRQQATPANLLVAIEAAAAGEGTLPPDLLARLLDQVGRIQRQVLSPRGLSVGGLTDREVSVLKLLADGLDTTEIGARLYFSERTVKTIIHEITTRLDLRNRTHAVAYAMRQGLI